MVGPTVWNALGCNLHDPELSFGRLLKMHLFLQYSVHPSALEALCDIAL